MKESPLSYLLEGPNGWRRIGADFRVGGYSRGDWWEVPLGFVICVIATLLSPVLLVTDRG